MKWRGAPVLLFCAGAPALHAQASAAVAADTLVVYAKPSARTAVVASLTRGDVVSVEFSSTGEGGVSWCSIRMDPPTPSLVGYVDCAALQRQVLTHVVRRRPPVPAAGAEADIEELLRTSGLHKQIHQLTDLASVQNGLRARGASPAETAKLAAILRTAFAPEAFLGPIRTALRREYSPAAVQPVLEWYRTPLAERVTAAEIRAASPDDFQAFTAFTQQLRSRPPSPERLALVRRLQSVVDISELQMAMVRSVLRGVARKLNPTLPPRKRLTESGLKTIVQQVEQQRPMLEELTTARLLYTYAAVSDDDLEQYVRFWESAAGRWFRNLYFRASLKAVDGAVANMVDILAGSPFHGL